MTDVYVLDDTEFLTENFLVELLKIAEEIEGE